MKILSTNPCACQHLKYCGCHYFSFLHQIKISHRIFMQHGLQVLGNIFTLLELSHHYSYGSKSTCNKIFHMHTKKQVKLAKRVQPAACSSNVRQHTWCWLFCLVHCWLLCRVPSLSLVHANESFVGWLQWSWAEKNMC